MLYLGLLYHELEVGRIGCATMVLSYSGTKTRKQTCPLLPFSRN